MAYAAEMPWPCRKTTTSRSSRRSRASAEARRIAFAQPLDALELLDAPGVVLQDRDGLEAELGDQAAGALRAQAGEGGQVALDAERGLGLERHGVLGAQAAAVLRVDLPKTAQADGLALAQVAERADGRDPDDRDRRRPGAAR